jgi:Zn-dependent peptidase ImmA (M78 family)/DNA-binding XRE family transcriptional regulator
MPKAARKRPDIPFNKAIFKWARERHRRSHEETAKRVGVTPQKIIEWEDEKGPAKPTVLQARKLAEIYERPFLEFFAKQVPDLVEPDLVPDFRMHRDAIPDESGGLLQIQSWAETHRLNAIDLFEILGDTPPVFPEALYGDVGMQASIAAARARVALNFPIEEQTNLGSADRVKLPTIIRQKLEGGGIIVLKNGDLKRFGARGLCIFAVPLPVIVFGNEAPGAQAFTLAHELGHVILRQSAISGAPPPRNSAGAGAAIEKWCNEFAGAFLVPEKDLARFMPRPRIAAADISDNFVATLATRFGISRHAMLVRLVTLGYVQSEYYWRIKRQQFIAEEDEYEAGGRAKYYGSRFRSSSGDLYTGLVLEAWSTGRITNHNAGEFMGIKNLAHLFDIRSNFGG